MIFLADDMQMMIYLADAMQLNERLFAESLMMTSDSTNYDWHENFWIAQNSTVKNILTKIPNFKLLLRVKYERVEIKFSSFICV